MGLFNNKKKRLYDRVVINENERKQLKEVVPDVVPLPKGTNKKKLRPKVVK